MIVGLALLASQGWDASTSGRRKLFSQTALESDPEYRAIIHQTFDETFRAAALTMLLAAGLSLLGHGGRKQRIRVPRR
jgi:hypothetical protein